MNDPITADICIVGAGPVGGALACRLAEAGRSVALIDHAELPPLEDPAYDGRAYAIAAGTQVLLAEAGLWDCLDIPPQPIRDIRVADGRAGRPPSRRHLHFDSRETGTGDQPFGWMIEARSLRKALNNRFPRQPGLRVFAPARAQVTSDVGAMRIALDDGTIIQARLAVAAEGRSSALREQAGIPVTRLPYHQTAIVCAIAHEQPHHGLALEYFLPAGPLAVLPMGPVIEHGRVLFEHASAVVWTERDATAAALKNLDAAIFTRELVRRLGTGMGRVQLVGRRWSYPLSAMLVHRYTDIRLALVGDAAHSIHPIAGQGLNLGLRDAADLAAIVMRHDDPGSPAALAEYEAKRGPEIAQMLAMTDMLDRLFSTNIGFIRYGRDLGIHLVNQAGPLKRFFTGRAMGVAA